MTIGNGITGVDMRRTTARRDAFHIEVNKPVCLYFLMLLEQSEVFRAHYKSSFNFARCYAWTLRRTFPENVCKKTVTGLTQMLQ